MPRINIVWMKSDKAWGYAEVKHLDPNHVSTIYLDKRMHDKELLRVAIHEWLHIKFPWLSESVVKRLSHSLADVLWRIGFRLKEDD